MLSPLRDGYLMPNSKSEHTLSTYCRYQYEQWLSNNLPKSWKTIGAPPMLNRICFPFTHSSLLPTLYPGSPASLPYYQSNFFPRFYPNAGPWCKSPLEDSRPLVTSSACRDGVSGCSRMEGGELCTIDRGVEKSHGT